METCATLAFLAAVLLAPVRLECKKTCREANSNDVVTGSCPITLSPARVQTPGSSYAERVTVRVLMSAEDVHARKKVEIHSPINVTLRPSFKRRRGNQVRCPTNSSAAKLLLEYDSIQANKLQVVNVSYAAASRPCSVDYTVPDPVPHFNLSVDQTSKSVTVTARPAQKVYTRLCYKANAFLCRGAGPCVIIDPSKSPSVQLNITYLLPCLCVEVYYTHSDARRNRTCPFEEDRVADIGDVWLSSKVELRGSTLEWVSRCPTLPAQLSASLCWMQSKHVCTPVFNSTLQRNPGGGQTYNMSAVDAHPQMCVQFSLNGSQHINCPFKADMSSWEAHIEGGGRGVTAYVTSDVPATFSAQFCVLDEMGCTPTGPVHALGREGMRISMVPDSVAEKPCVQVWQSDPALSGKRILCPDYTHNRCGMFALAALVFVVVVGLLGVFIHRLTRSGAAGWLYIQKPVLLVCSSEDPAHISAVCALASILQGELSAKVHMALWAQSSDSQTGAGAGVADLGPIPWLYGQWEAVRKAQGKILMIWSPEAKKTYEKWSKERATVEKSEKKIGDDGRAELRHDKMKVDDDERLEERKQAIATGIKDCDDKDCYQQKEASPVTGPVFAAALACLEGALQQPKGLGVAIVYFQGLGHSGDIPKALRGVPRYCLPQGFRGLIQELGGMRRPAENGKDAWHCWHRLLSKVLSIWLARTLAHRLETLLPQAQGKHASPQTQGRPQSPLEATAARTGPAPELEPLQGPPRRAERR